MQPSQTASQPDNSTGLPAPVKQTLVMYSGPDTDLAGLPAILEWSGDNHIRLYTVNAQMISQKLEFDLVRENIKKFAVGVGRAFLTLQDDQVYILDFSKKPFEEAPRQGFFTRLLFMDSYDRGAMISPQAAADLDWWGRNLPS